MTPQAGARMQGEPCDKVDGLVVRMPLCAWYVPKMPKMGLGHFSVGIVSVTKYVAYHLPWEQSSWGGGGEEE